jgi:hypothetical protein
MFRHVASFSHTAASERVIYAIVVLKMVISTAVWLSRDAVSFQVPSGISSGDVATVPLAAATTWLTFFKNYLMIIARPKDCSGLGDVCIFPSTF